MYSKLALAFKKLFFVLPGVVLMVVLSLVAQGEETYHKGGDWVREHGKQAGRPSASCTDCHSPSYCSDCHSKNQELLPEAKNPDTPERSYTHRGDYRSRHAGEARTDPARCLRCHSTESCQSCHEREGLTIGATNYPHPAGWLVSGSAEFHGRVARQDIVLCASCHERGSATNCITCHSTGATTTSPHPSGWNPGQNRQSDPACTGCH